jgi:hypothetical protein
MNQAAVQPTCVRASRTEANWCQMDNTPLSNFEPRAGYARFREPDGSLVCICMNCLLTVARGQDETHLLQATGQGEHVCPPESVCTRKELLPELIWDRESD